MRRPSHLKGGVFAGGAINYYDQNHGGDEFSCPELIISAGLGSIGGILPDILEPPDSIYHRKFGHSYTCLIGINALMIYLNKRSKLKFVRFLRAFLAGYQSHLVLDFTTEMGLPLK